MGDVMGRLSPAMTALLDDMRGGVKVHLMKGYSAYFFRDDNFKRCSAQVDGLLKRGLVELYDESWCGAMVRPVPQSPT